MSDQRYGTARRAVAILGLVLVAALAGCSFVGSPLGESESLPGGEEAATRAGQLDGVEKTSNVTLVHEGNATWSVQRVSVRPRTGEFRNELRSQGPASAEQPLGEQSLVVSNGSVRYIYDSEENRVFRSEVSREQPDRPAELRRLFAALSDDDAEPIPHPTPGVSPLPVVPVGNQSSASGDDPVRWREQRVTARYNGTATVAGRPAYVVDLRPATGEGSLVESTLWLDTEYLYPLRSHRVVERNGERYEYTSVVRSLTFNPEFPAGTFEFDPDAVGDPTVVESASYDSRAEIVSDLDQSVPDPEVPAGFEFESGYLSDGDPRHLSMTYAGDNGSLRVSVFDEPANLTGGRETSLDGRPAVFRTFDDRRFLLWNAGNRQYSVSGSVGNGTLRRVADSLVD